MNDPMGNNPKRKKLGAEDVMDLVKNESSRVLLRVQKSKSNVWSSFRRVLVDGKEVDFVSCTKCSAVLSHTTGVFGCGTSHLSRHLKTHDPKPLPSGQSPITTYIPKKIPAGQKRACKQDLARAAALAAALDIRPLSAIEGKSAIFGHG